MSDSKSPDAKSPPELSMDEILASIQRIIAEDQRSGPIPPAGPSARADADIIELTDALNDDGSVRRLAPFAGRPAAAAAAATMEFGEPEPADPPPPAAAGEAIAADEPLLSEAPASAAAASFRELAEAAPHAPRHEPEPAMVGGRPLDDVVRELLRPLLRSWLDENLPQIVERLVAAEIARIAARGGIE